jgi:hypothetical protein
MVSSQRSNSSMTERSNFTEVARTSAACTAVIGDK